ncbi:MAG TPA: hypothetical protein VGQ28_03860 [Thermoanaerobaculia bacterium]|nr:hypothetical protein [Thermoanaerobaculia bacterium]
MATKRDQWGEPPSPEELLAYRDGRLEPEERQWMEARIAVYPDAARALADLAAFPEVEPAPGRPELSDLSEDEIGARWQAFRQRLPELPVLERQKDPPEPVQALPRFKTGVERGGYRSSFLKLAAAALIGLAVGWAAGFLGGRLSREQASGPESAINVKIAELTPDEESGSRSAPAPLEMPEGSEELVLMLGIPVQKDYSLYEAEIVDAKGARIWTREGLHPTALGTFQVSFRAGVLQPGTLRLRLFGRDGKARTLIASYELRLAAGTGPH